MGCGSSNDVTIAGNKEMLEVAECPNLTNQQRATLIASWDVIKVDLETICLMMFMGLFESHPQVRDIFEHSEDKDLVPADIIKAHGMRIMGLLGRFVSNLESNVDDNLLGQPIHDLGRKHVDFKAPPYLFDVFALQIQHIIKSKLEQVWTDEIGDAWKVMFDIIVFNLKSGQNQEMQDRGITV